MSLYYIAPSRTISDINFKNIMFNLTNDISKIFVNNKQIIVENNYDLCLNSIVEIINNYLKLYEFYNYGIENINVEIYNNKINVIMYVYVIIYKYYFQLQKSSWTTFYNGNIDKQPLVYYNLNDNQRQELNISIVNGDFFMYGNIQIVDDFDEGIILKKKKCVCDSNNCTINSDYIITIYWNKST